MAGIRQLRSILILATFLLGGSVGSIAVAQPHAQGWLYTAGTHLGVMNNGGSVTTFLQSPSQVVMKNPVMRADNRAVCVAVEQGSGVASLLEVDLSGSILATLPLPGTFNAPVVEVDQDGDYVVAAHDPFVRASTLFRLRPGGAISTLTTMSLVSDIEIDQRTGDLLVLKAASLAMDLVRVSANGNSITTVARFDIAGQVAFDPRSDDVFLGESARGPLLPHRLVRVTRTGVATSMLTLPYWAAGFALDRLNAPVPTGIAATHGVGVHRIDLASRTTTAISNTTDVIDSIVPFRGRNVGTTQRVGGHWRVDIDFPGEAGAGYALAASISGTSPGVPLPDGRTIPLLADVVTGLALQGGLAPILRNNIGILDATGHAIAEFDVRSVPAIAGTPVWFVAVTLSSAGIRTISDPWLVRV